MRKVELKHYSAKANVSSRKLRAHPLLVEDIHSTKLSGNAGSRVHSLKVRRENPKGNRKSAQS